MNVFGLGTGAIEHGLRGQLQVFLTSHMAAQRNTTMAHTLGGDLALGVWRFYKHFPSARRKELFPVLALMLLSAMSEMMTIGAVLPFLTMIANPEAASAASPALFAAFGWREGNDMLLPATIFFALATLFAALIRLAFVKEVHKFLSRLAHDLNVEVYRRALYQPYSYHLAQNTSEIIAGLAKVELVIYTLLSPLLQVLIAALISLAILTFLVVIDAGAALTAAVGFGALYLTVTYLMRRRLRENGRIAATAHSQRVKTVQEGLGAIRDVLIDRSQRIYIDKLKKLDWAFQKAEAANLVMGSAPRFVIEALGMTLIAAVTVILISRSGGIAAVLPILGALALSSQRVLPLFQVMYHGWAQVSGNLQMLVEVLALLDRPVATQSLAWSGETELQSWRRIAFESVSFRYSELGPWVLRGVSYTIERGARIGILGKTGSGKSTLMDLFMGLLAPTEGVIRIDGEILEAEKGPNWQTQIAHVPQSIYLADATIAENIAFGIAIEQIDMDRVRRAATQASIAAFVESLADGYESAVGERGVRLSGGQRQRIGIARALYKRASVLVFDEATSALDSETEASVVQAIQSLDRDLTILIVAHRPSIIAICDKVIKLDECQTESESIETTLVVY